MKRPAITQPMRRAVAVRCGGRAGWSSATECVYCGDLIVIRWPDPRRVQFVDRLGRSRPELDHVVPLSRGGPHTVANLVPACLRCNRSKCARLTEANA